MTTRAYPHGVIFWVSVVTMAGCPRPLDIPPATYACSLASPSCPAGDVCILPEDGDDGICGVLDECHASDGLQMARPVDDCTPCVVADDDEETAGLCHQGRCEAPSCTFRCGPPRCGDGCTDTDEGEECDPPNQPFNTGQCVSDCVFVGCGNARQDPGEDCDDDNDNPFDHCHLCAARTITAVPEGIPVELPVDASAYEVRTEEHCIVRCTDNDPCETVLGRCGEPGSLGPHLFLPTAVAVDAAGVLYVSDTGNDRVVRAAGDVLELEVVVGDSVSLAVESGVPARAMPLAAPTGLAFDSFGTLYIVTAQGLAQVLFGGAGADDDELVSLEACYGTDDGPYDRVHVVDVPEWGETIVVSVSSDATTPQIQCRSSP